MSELDDIQARLREADQIPRTKPKPPLQCHGLRERLTGVHGIEFSLLDDALREVADWLASLQPHERIFAHEAIRRTIQPEGQVHE